MLGQGTGADRRFVAALLRRSTDEACHLCLQDVGDDGGHVDAQVRRDEAEDVFAELRGRVSNAVIDIPGKRPA